MNDLIYKQDAINANCYNCSIKANGGKCSKCDAVKAIEKLPSVKQESSIVLNNIQKEIEQYNLQPPNYPCHMISIGVVLQIIDKYRTVERSKE